MFRKVTMVLVAALIATALAYGNVETVSRIFTLEHVSVSEASAAIQPMLSEVGSLTLQPGLSRMTVQDVAEVVDRVAAVIRELDRVPETYTLKIELLEGGRPKPYGTRDEVEVDDRLRKMFKVDAFRRLGSSTINGQLGNQAQADLSADFRVSFLAQHPTPQKNSPWGTPDPGHRISLRPLLLERMVTSTDGSMTADELLRTNVLLSRKQTVYIGAGNSEDSDSVLVLIVRAMEGGSD